MPKPRRGPRLGAGPSHQKQMLANQATELLRHGRIRTTKAKAKTLGPYTEKLITKAKQGDLHARRQVASKLRDPDVVTWLFEDVAPRFADRDGGYTRTLKIGPRKGDNASMVMIELVEYGWEDELPTEEDVEEGRFQRLRSMFGRGETSAAPEPEDAAEAEEPEEREAPEPTPSAEEAPAEEQAPPSEDERIPGVQYPGDAPEEPSGEDQPVDEVTEPDEAPGPAEEPRPPGEDPGKPVERRDNEPDAGDTTGG